MTPARLSSPSPVVSARSRSRRARILKTCEPDTTICVGVGAKKSCLADGSGYGAIEELPEGEYCSDGKCASSCAVDPKFGATVGCTFWTVDLPNYPDLLFVNPMNEPHAVVISNPGEMDTEVTFTAQDGSFNDAAVVPAGSLSVFLMPVMNVGDTTITAKGIKIESTRPVLVHQFNPWNNEASNDASLLIPEPFLGRDYMVLSWPTTALELLFDRCRDESSRLPHGGGDPERHSSGRSSDSEDQGGRRDLCDVARQCSELRASTGRGAQHRG